MVKLLQNHPKYYRKGLSEFYDDFDHDFSKSAKALGDQFIPSGYIFWSSSLNSLLAASSSPNQGSISFC
jgi:hypothetical protein